MPALLLLLCSAFAEDLPPSSPPPGSNPDPGTPGPVEPEPVPVPVPVEPVGGEALPSASAAAPVTAGAVVGTILSDRGIPLPGARVYTVDVQGTALTDSAGRFSLALPPGVYTLYADAPGFDTTRLDAVPVTAGGEAEVAFELWESVKGGADVVVTGSAVVGGTAQLLAERRAAATVTDSVGATQMARAGDSDAASAMRRVTGLTVVGGKYVYVRGLGDRYSATLLNGSTLPSPEPEKRVVPLDLFPTSLLEAVVIQKAFSPDLPAEFGGGVVQIRTRGIPNKGFFSLGLSGGYVHGTTFGEGLSGVRGPTDYLGLGRAFRALPPSIAETSEPLKAAGMFSETGFTSEELAAFGEALPNHWSIDPRQLPPDVGGTIAFGDRFTIGSVDVGGQLGVVYNNAWSQDDGNRKVYSASDGVLELKRETTYTETRNTIRVGGALSLGAEWGADSTLVSTTLLNRNSVATAAVYDADDPTATTDTRTSWVDWIEQQLLFEQVAGSIRVGGLVFTPRYAYAEATGVEPDRREYTYTLAEDGTYYLSQFGGSNDILYGNLRDRTHDGTLEIGLPVRLQGGSGMLKVGGGLVDRVRTGGTRRFSYEFHGSQGIDLSLPADEIFVASNIGASETGDPGWLELEEVTSNSDDYTATARIANGYFMADLPWVRRFRSSLGVRVEQSTQNVATFENFDADLEPVVAELATTDVLPAANLTFGVGKGDGAETMLVRLGYGRTVSRPELRELSEVSYFDYRTGRLYFGNPELERALIDNVDLRWEWYPSASESLSLGAFYKHFADPIESVVAVSAVSGSVGTFANATAATNLGGEIDVRQGLGVISPALSEFYVAGNAAYIYSRVNLEGTDGNQTSDVRPLQGQSPYIVNLQFGYDHDATRSNATLLYNVFGPRIVEVGTAGIPDTFELPVHRLDLVLTQGIGDHWKLRAKGGNLLNWPSRKRTGTAISEEETGGWSAGLGLTWTPT